MLGQPLGKYRAARVARTRGEQVAKKSRSTLGEK